MAIDQQALLRALQTVTDPYTGKDFVSTKAIKHVQVQGDAVSFELELGYPARSQHAALQVALTAAAQTVPGV